MEEGHILLPNLTKETCFIKLKSLQSVQTSVSEDSISSPSSESSDDYDSQNGIDVPSDDLSVFSKDALPNPMLLSRNSTITSSKVRVATNEREEKFLKRAIGFLSNIETGLVIEHADARSESPLIQRNYSSSHNSNLDSSESEFQSCWISLSGRRKVSYAHFLNPISEISSRKLMDFEDYPPCLRPGPMKDLYNERFREQYIYIEPKLTLSKIVNLREDFIIHICKILDIEACTVALAWSYFERLIQKNLVTKANRKLYGGCCLLLAYKFNEETHLEESKMKLQSLMAAIYALDKNDVLTTKDLNTAEFTVYASLEFSLKIEIPEFKASFLHILQRMETTPYRYLGVGTLYTRERASSDFAL